LRRAVDEAAAEQRWKLYAERLARRTKDYKSFVAEYTDAAVAVERIAECAIHS